MFQAKPAQAAGTGNPKIPSPPWLHAPGPAHPKDLGKYVTSHPSTKIVPIPHAPHATMKPVTLAVTSQAQLFISKDHTLEIDIPTDTISATQMQTAGGSVHLKIVQLDAGSGGGAGQIILGSYQLLLQDAAGHPLTTVVLAHPLTITYHLQTYQQPLLLQGQTVYAFWDGSQSAPATTGNSGTSGQGGQKPTSLKTSADPARTSWSVSTTLSNAVSTHLQAQATLPALANSSVTFGTAAPQASWGTPTDFQVGLNAGGLSYNYPLDLPPGPGGLTPPVSLNYNSGSVNESHNVQAAATWVGEGWSLGLGSISWSTRNVTPGGTNRIENVWTINDPSGISGQLIPPRSQRRHLVPRLSRHGLATCPISLA
ncbi:MAG: hypothetical protein M3Z08_08715 [Chloroflexota bacterium]|nr:hypothetical protein [Chloroflexota bacterium]